MDDSSSKSVLLSIIIPVFNSERFIREAICSAVSVLGDDSELIIIDGGSSDNTVAIIEEYISSVSYFVSENDKGWNDAFLKGVKVANGKYIIMLSADDRLIHDGINNAKPYLNGVDCLCGSIIREFDDGRFELIRSNPNINTLNYSCSLRHPATFFRRESLIEYDSLPNTWICANDRERFLRFYYGGASILVVDIPIAIMRGSGLSSNHALTSKEDDAISISYGRPVLEIVLRRQLNKLVYGTWALIKATPAGKRVKELFGNKRHNVVSISEVEATN